MHMQLRIKLRLDRAIPDGPILVKIRFLALDL